MCVRVCVCVLIVGSSIGRIKILEFDSSMCVYVCADRGFKHRSRQGHGVWLEYVCVCVLIVGSSIGRVKVMVFDSSMCVCVLTMGSSIGHVNAMVLDTSICVCVLTVGSSIGRVKIMVFDSSMCVCVCVCVCVDRGFKHRSRQAKNYKIDCLFLHHKARSPLS